MLGELLIGLERLPLAVLLKGSVWLYPLVNTLHIVGIALLLGAIVPLDLRLLGLWRGVPIAVLSRVLLPVAVAGLTIAVCAGGLLFITKASDYAASSLFQMKLAVIALAIANALALRLVPAWRKRGPAHPSGEDPMARAAGAVSILLWLGAITLGRLVGYF